MFKVIIAGGRDFKYTTDHLHQIDFILQNYYDFKAQTPKKQGLEMVTGACPTGADQIPYYYHDMFNVPIKEFPANWNKYDNAAGPIRNRQMAEYADALIAFWDGKSTGTSNMITEAKKRGLKIRIIKY